VETVVEAALGTDRSEGLRRGMRWAGIALVAIAAGAAVSASLGQHLPDRPGGLGYVLRLLLMVALYAVAGWLLTRRTPVWLAVSRSGAMPIGVITGAMWMVSLTIETWAGLSGWTNIALTAPLLLGGMGLWAVAAARAGVLAGVYAAMICVTATVAFGLMQPWYALDRLAHNIDGSPEYLASGWHDLHAFAVANTLDAGFTHMIIAPVIATVVGSIGALAQHARRR
jgi:hypothetical protein